MQRRLRPKRELRSLLQRLNDCVGVSARHVYTKQIAMSDVLQRPQSEIHRQLPELCEFVDSLLPLNRSTAPPSSVVRCAFRHPDAQWLSRSARQSGISALLCQQLVRLARQDSSGETVNDNTIYWSAAELTMHILLDALLSPCGQRLGHTPDACNWHPGQPKPRFHAMTCFPVWSALLPFAALMGLRFPNVFLQVLKEYRHLEKKNRVNCDFAQVTGIWRLVEELNRSDKENQEKVTQVMTSLLRLASDKMVGSFVAAKEEQKIGAHLDDQLLEKFFTGLQGFSFKCGRANMVLKPALFGAIQDSTTIPAGRTKGVVLSQRFVVFTAVGCVFVKDLAVDVVSTIIKQVNDLASEEAKGHLLAFLVGFCTHVDLVPLASVIELLGQLVSYYKTVTQNDKAPEAQRQRRLELVFSIVYVALHRCQSVDKLRQEISSDATSVMETLNQLQMQLCSDIAFEDYYVAAPVHWTAKIWKHWVFLSDEEVHAFVSEAQENDNDTEQMFKDRVSAWQTLETRFPFQPTSLPPQFTQMKALLKPHLIPSIPLAEPTDGYEFDVQFRKRRRTEVAMKIVDQEQRERSYDVLLVPDVMERVCSFMSAKRLCRMALVCRTYASVCGRASLWRPLYLQVGLISNKSSLLPSAPVECHHGEGYEHNWRQLYQERWKVLRTLRRMQRRAMGCGKVRVGEGCSSSTFIPQICSYCGCDQVFKTASDRDAHQVQHKRFTCTEPSCRASFAGLQKFKAHVKEHGAAYVSSDTRLVCDYDGCMKSYSSAKRLATHRQRENHFHFNAPHR